MSLTAHNQTQNSDPADPEKPKGTWRWHWVMVLVCLAATGVVAPMVFLGNASGHDIQFHVASWVDVRGQWREGILFPRWAEWANWGYGEPRFIFYPPASWLLGALLGTVLPWKATTGVFVWIALVLAGMNACVLARDWMPEGAAAAAAVLYAVNPYRLANVYYRSDYAELLATAIFPLLVWGALRVIRQGWSALPLAAIPLAVIWLSNAPAGVIATYSLCLILAAGCLATHSWKPLARGAVGMATGFGLAAFYIFPAAWEQKWVQIEQVVYWDLQPVHNFLFVKGVDPEFLFFNLKMSFVALGMILLTGIAAVFAARRRKEFPELWWTALALGAVATFLMFSASAFAWKWLPELQFLQFPWRWLEPLGLAFALFAAAAFPGGRIGRRVWLAFIAAAIIAAGVAMASDAWWDTEDSNYIVESIESGKGYEGTDEYAPVGADRSDLPEEGPRIALMDGKTGRLVPVSAAEIRIEKWTAERIEFASEARSSETLVLRRLNYPAWKGRIDGQQAKLQTLSNTGEIVVPLAAGQHQVEIDFGRTWDRTAGGAISILSAIGLAGFEWVRRRSRTAGA